MMKKLLYILCFSLSFYTVKAQTVFNNVYNDFSSYLTNSSFSFYNSESFTGILELNSGDYLLCGGTSPDFQLDSFQSSIYLCKINSTGDTVSSSRIDVIPHSRNVAFRLLELQNGNIFLFGFTSTSVYDSDYIQKALAIRLDEDLNVLFVKDDFLFGPQERVLNAIHDLDSECFYLLSYAYSDTINNEFDVFLSKMDYNGNLVFSHQFGQINSDFALDFEQLSDGSFILSGTTYSNTIGTLGEADIYVLRVDTFGNVLWEKSYGYSQSDLASDNKNLFIQNNEIYVVGGHEKSDGNDVGWLLKLDLNGDTLWTKMYDRGEEFDRFYAIEAWDDSSLIILGSTRDYSVLPSIKPTPWLLKIDLLGNIIWDRIINRYPNDANSDTYPYDMTLASDGGILLSGYVINQSIQTNGIFHRNDAWFAKTDSCGFTVGAEPQALLTIDSVVGTQVYISNLSEEYCIANMEIAFYDSTTGDTTILDSLDIYAYSQYTNGEDPNQLVYTLPDTGTYVFSLTTYAGDGMDSFSTGIQVSDISTGILSNTLNHDFDWNIYPNPTKDFIIVSFSEYKEFESELTIEVLNLTGQVVHSNILIPNQLQQKMLLPELNNGVYLIRLQTNQQVVGVRKLVVIN